jgi:hypothetical protein
LQGETGNATSNLGNIFGTSVSSWSIDWSPYKISVYKQNL